mmetsp:Transcript_8451/g.9831  ORF Transcript_8451/g.9831 Transcript_8451/m.9831 type:complete len:114 (-) Transcript_8451:151-492(-)
MATRMATSTATSALTKQPATHHLAASTTTASTSAATASFYNNNTSSPPGTTKGQQIPNRFTQAFHEMKEVCPNSISLYASCVLETERSQSISRHSCAKEFRQVKDCFRKVRGL